MGREEWTPWGRIDELGHADTVKIGLLTPYSGGNLGDGAIQDAVIQNILIRYPTAEIWGFTLNPDDTERRHGIRAFPSAGMGLEYYSLVQRSGNVLPSAVKPDSTERSGKRFSRVAKEAKSLLRKVPRTYGALRAARTMGQSAVAEIKHVALSHRILRDFDALIVSGGGQLNAYWGGAWGQPYVLFKWALISKLTGTRFIFLSVGLGELDTALSRFFVKWALKLASYRSYRDWGSLELLREMHLGKSDPVLPDLAFSYQPVPKRSATNGGQCGKIVGISPIAYLSRQWPKSDVSFYDRYIEAMASFADKLISQGYTVLFFTTDTPDRRAVRQIMDRLQRSKTSLENTVMNPFIDTVNDVICSLDTVDFVVASRLHSVILAHLMHKPVLAVSYDRKVTVYMEEMSQTDCCLDIQLASADKLMGCFQKLVRDARAVIDKIDLSLELNRERLESAYDEVLGGV